MNSKQICDTTYRVFKKCINVEFPLGKVSFFVFVKNFIQQHCLKTPELL